MSFKANTNYAYLLLYRVHIARIHQDIIIQGSLALKTAPYKHKSAYYHSYTVHSEIQTNTPGILIEQTHQSLVLGVAGQSLRLFVTQVFIQTSFVSQSCWDGVETEWLRTSFLESRYKRVFKIFNLYRKSDRLSAVPTVLFDLSWILTISSYGKRTITSQTTSDSAFKDHG